MSFTFPYRGPIPPFTNLPIAPQNYNPSQFFISAITLGTSTTVTTTVNLNYVIGQLVKLIIPTQFGSRQLNEQEGYVLAIPASNQVVISIDSSKNVDAFKSSPSTPTQPQILALGNINQGQINTGRANNATNIPGSFINVSP